MTQRVFLINRYFFPDHSATSQLVSDLAFQLAEDGYEVRVLASRQRYDNPRFNLLSTEIIKKVLIHRVWTSQFGRTYLSGRTFDYLSFYVTSAFALLRQCREGDIIIAKTDPPLISVIAGVIAKLRRATLVNWLQDLFPEVAVKLDIRGATIFASLLKPLRDMSLRLAALNVVIGERMQERVAGVVCRARLRVIHNWADGQSVRPLSREQNPLRTEWKLQDAFVVGYSGNMGRAHDFETIIGAADILRHEPDIIFLFVGGGAKLKSIARRATELRLPNVWFKPYQPQHALGMSLSVSDIHLVSLNPKLEGFIVPSKFYGISAAGRGTVFIGDPDGEIPRILNRYKCGFTITSSDSQGLAECIRQLRSDPVLAASLGKNARHVFQENFDKRIALNLWGSLLEDLANAATDCQTNRRA